MKNCIKILSTSSVIFNFQVSNSARSMEDEFGNKTSSFDNRIYIDKSQIGKYKCDNKVVKNNETC